MIKFALCAFHSFLVEVHSNAGHIHLRRMHNNNLEIRIGAPLVTHNQNQPMSGLTCVSWGKKFSGRAAITKRKNFPRTPTSEPACRLDKCKYQIALACRLPSPRYWYHHGKGEKKRHLQTDFEFFETSVQLSLLTHYFFSSLTFARL